MFGVSMQEIFSTTGSSYKKILSKLMWKLNFFPFFFYFVSSILFLRKLKTNKNILLYKQILSIIGDNDYLGIDLIDDAGERLKNHNSTVDIVYLYNIETVFFSEILIKCKIAVHENQYSKTNGIF